MLRQRARRQSIFITLGIIIIATVVTIMSLHALYSYIMTKEKLVAEMHHSAQLSAQALNQNAAGLIEAYAVNEYEHLILTDMHLRKSFAIIIQDFNMGKILGEAAYISGKIRNPGGKIIDYDPDNRDHNRWLAACYYSETFPIENQKGKELGTVSIYRSGRAMQSELNTIIKKTVIVTVTISFFLIVVLFFTIRRFILQPISDIVTVMGQSDADGIPTLIIPTKGPKEIRTLAVKMNTMIGTIKNSRAQLKELNTQLHRKIQEGVQENTRLEKEKLEQEKLLIEQSKMAAMGEMISAIAHQWRQPLSSLSLDVQDLLDAKEYGELDDKYLHDMVDRALHTIHYMSQTIDDFRSFFLPNKKKEPFSIFETVEATKHLLEKQFEAHSIRIVNEGSDFWVDGFKNEFQQVLINLLNNAKDAISKKRSESHSFKGIVTVSYRDHTITVTDNGGGIPDEIMDRIFEPYFSTKFSAQGTGIGLYMTKTIIERNMGGTIRAYNNDTGAVFEITLPASNP